MSVNMKQFAVDLLHHLGAPVNHQTVSSIMGWQMAEGGANHNNPFNTTYDMPGASTFNSVGVKSYKDYSDALHATVNTLLHSDPKYGYGAIVGALKSSNPKAFTQAIANSSGGTGALTETTGAEALKKN